ncbi:MAG: hypothetical protein QM658_01490 [Gordonia sp. (in: high G+C Gram-positive bacteria)]
MSRNHRQPTRRELRRAQERSEPNRRARKAALAAGAVVASASIAFGPGIAHAEQLNSVQNAENGYATWNNLIIVADNLGRTQGALLAPLRGLAPDGSLPTTTNTRTGDSTKMTFIEGLPAVVGAAMKTPSTEHVPGAAGVLGAGALAAGLPQYATVLPTVLAAGNTATTVTPKSAATIAALLGIDATTLTKNTAADVTGLLGDKVDQHAGYIAPKLDLNNPLGLLGLPDVQHDSSAWSNSYDWPMLQINGKTWMVQDRYTVDPVTSAALKDKYREQIGTLDTLQVQKGQTKAVHVGDDVTQIPWCLKWGGFLNLTCKQWGTKDVVTPKYETQFVPELGADGKPVYETTYDPNLGVENALDNLNGIDVAGFSFLKREAGGEYKFLDGSLGWLTSTTQVIVPGVGGKPDQVTTVPLSAAGVALPFGLLTAGGLYTPGIVTQNGQTVSSTLGSRSQGLAIPLLGLGVDTTSLLESFQMGPDGIAYNSGWTLGTIDAGLGVPIPVLYSLGSFNVGPKGVGYTSPSFFGVGLPSFQLGTTPGSTAIDGDILSQLTGVLGDKLPTSLIVLDPKTLFALLNITDPTGLGLTDPFDTTQKALNPLFTGLVTPSGTALAQLLADQATKSANSSSSLKKKLSGDVAGLTGKLAEHTEDAAKKAAEGPGSITVTGPTTKQSVEQNPIVVNDPEPIAPITKNDDTAGSDKNDADTDGSDKGADKGDADTTPVTETPSPAPAPSASNTTEE